MTHEERLPDQFTLSCAMGPLPAGTCVRRVYFDMIHRIVYVDVIRQAAAKYTVVFGYELERGGESASSPDGPCEHTWTAIPDAFTCDWNGCVTDSIVHIATVEGFFNACFDCVPPSLHCRCPWADGFMNHNVWRREVPQRNPPKDYSEYDRHRHLLSTLVDAHPDDAVVHWGLAGGVLADGKRSHDQGETVSLRGGLKLDCTSFEIRTIVEALIDYRLGVIQLITPASRDARVRSRYWYATFELARYDAPVPVLSPYEIMRCAVCKATVSVAREYYTDENGQGCICGGCYLNKISE